MNKLHVLSLAAIALVMQPLPAFSLIISETTDNFGLALNNKGQAAWVGKKQSGMDVYFYDGNDTQQIGDTVYRGLSLNNVGALAWSDGYTINLFQDGSNITIGGPFSSAQKPFINQHSQIAWAADGNIYVYENGQTQQLTDVPGSNLLLGFNEKGQALWARDDGQGLELYFHDGTQTLQLTDNTTDDYPGQLNDRGEVAWISNDDVYLYDPKKGVQQITDTPEIEAAPVLNNGGQIAWLGNYSGTVRDVFVYDGKVKQLTFDSLNGGVAINKNGNLVWETLRRLENGEMVNDFNIAYYDGKSIRELLPDPGARVFESHLNDKGLIAWSNGSAVHLSDISHDLPPIPNPEPTTMLLFGIGIPTALLFLKKRSK